MNDIDTMKTWNKRLKERMEISGYKTQTEFAEAFNNIYGTKCTQTDISRWLRVGESNKKYNKNTYTEKKEIIGFPSFMNMKRVAEMLNVTVAYLTGETDYDSFNLEKACTYTGISQGAMKTICSMTRPDRNNHGLSYSGGRLMFYEDARDTISKVFESSEAPRFIFALQELLKVYSGPDKTQTMWHELESKYDRNLINEAFEHIDDNPEVGDSRPPAEVIHVISDIQNIIDTGYSQQVEEEYDTDVYRYRAQRAFDALIDNIFPYYEK